MPEFDSKRLSAIVDAIPFAKTCGMILCDVDEGEGTLSLAMEASAAISRMEGSGQIHGGAIAALIDTAGTMLAVAKTGQPVPTVNLRTDFIKPAGGGRLLAKAHLRRIGRKVSVVDVDVTDADGTLIAIGRGTFGGSG